MGILMNGHTAAVIAAVASGTPRQHNSSQSITGRAMPKVPSLLFDIEMDVHEEAPSSDDGGQEAIFAAISSLLVCSSEHQRQVKRLAQEAMQRGGASSGRLEDVLKSRGFRVEKCTTREPGKTECLQNLRHTFMICTAEGRQAEPIVVDPVFRDQFEMANPTRSYARLMTAVPALFVGTEHHLQQVVTIVCREMHAAFTAQGASIPPWRSKASFLSKWKIPLALSAGSPRELRPVQPLAPLRHRGPYKAAWPGVQKMKVSGGPPGCGRRAAGAFCRVGSQGAMSSASDCGSDLVAPLH